MVISVSGRAAAEILALRQRSSVDSSVHLRVDVIGGATSGFAYDIFFDDIHEDDDISEQHGVTVVVRPDSAEYLRGSELDWVVTDNGAGFVVRNPNEPEK